MGHFSAVKEDLAQCICKSLHSSHEGPKSILTFFSCLFQIMADCRLGCAEGK